IAAGTLLGIENSVSSPTSGLDATLCAHVESPTTIGILCALKKGENFVVQRLICFVQPSGYCERFHRETACDCGQPHVTSQDQHERSPLPSPSSQSLLPEFQAGVSNGASSRGPRRVHARSPPCASHIRGVCAESSCA